jgi:hypothetical protein
MCCEERVMRETQFGGLIVAAVLTVSTMAALNFTTMYTFAQNATSAKNTTAVGNMTGGSTTSSSSCGSGSTASSCYDAGYQNALANPGKTCPSGHSYNYCAGWSHARSTR